MFLGIDLWDWLYLFLFLVLGLALGFFVPQLLQRWMGRFKDEMSLPHIVLSSVIRPLRYLLVFICIGIGFRLMSFPIDGLSIYNGCLLTCRGLSLACIVWACLKLIDGFAIKAAKKAAETETKVDDMVVPIIRDLAKIAVIALGFILILQNLGYSVSSLIAGLGIGGAAIALASKDTLANFFGSIVVFLDKPFEAGDWICIDNVEGEVCEIRMRTTIIQTVENSIITIPNSLLTNTHIDNYGRRSSRKMDCNFGVYYNTTAEQIENIVQDIKKYVEDHQDIFTKTYWIAFTGFGDSSLDIGVTVYTHETTKAKHLALKQQFLLEIMRIVAANGTGFAYPTRSLDMSALGQQPLRVEIHK